MRVIMRVRRSARWGWFLALALAAGGVASAASADTVAHWRFEPGAGRFTRNEGPVALRLVGLGVDGTRPSEVAVTPTSAAARYPSAGPNLGAARFEGKLFQVFRVLGEQPPADLLGESFTLEALVRLDSIARRTYATILAHGGGWDGSMAWQLIVTGSDSSHGAGQLLFQFSTDGTMQDGLATLKPDIQLEIGKRYYVAFAFDANQTSPEGAVFHVASAEDGWAIRTRPVERKVRGLFASSVPLSIGAGLRERGAGYNCWDGVIEEVRLTRGQLAVGDLLLAPR
jgi:hypothetical protein